MRFQRYRSVGLAALSSALVLLSANVGATSSTNPVIEDDSTLAVPVISCLEDYFADGDCDPRNNREECGYDGGDCCECTCVNTANYTCGSDHHGGYACLDPSAPCVDDDDITILPEYEYTSPTSSTTSTCFEHVLADGDCDPINNNEDCGYDGGDCCECTCVDTPHYRCGSEHHGGYACLDPSAPCVDDDDVTTLPEFEYTSYSGRASSLCFVSGISDGDCDPSNNNADCGYDGGDCCECTCVSTVDYSCGDDFHGGYACIDPSAACVDDDDITSVPEYRYNPYSERTSSACFTAVMADGDCDPNNNNEECGYDGGDCCECTCVSTEDYSCGDDHHGGYACLDPSAPCVDDDDVTTLPDFNYYGSYTGSSRNACYTFALSDGDCDPTNNNEECGYDGGDCCQCTCVSTEGYTCGDHLHGGYACLDPSAPCVDDDDVTTLPDFEYVTYTGQSSSICFDSVIADGDCDPANNNAACGYDGGDCCECTCVTTAIYTCGDDIHGGYTCVDPTATCFSGYVEAGTKTTITVSANAYDTRPGQAGGDVGCGADGCVPALSRDGIIGDAESRWSCAQGMAPGGGPCEIEFRFQDPQDIMDVQVAFYKGDERSRTLEATINGEVAGQFDSSPGSVFSHFGIASVAVHTLKLSPVHVADNGWIALLEVRFLVEP